MISYSSGPLEIGGNVNVVFANGLPALIDYNINYAQNTSVTILLCKEKSQSESRINLKSGGPTFSLKALSHYEV